VEKDLYLGTSWVSKAFVHIRRKKEEELTDEDKVIVDIRTGKLDPAMGDKSQASEKWESRSAGVWVKRSAKRHASDSKKTITAVDVLFGADAVEARPGWELVQNGPLHLDTGGDDKAPRLSIRRGQPVKLEKPTPRIRKDGKFKIMQISDLHLSTGVRRCRDPEPKDYNGGHCDADTRTLEFVEKLLDEEKPDLVVLSGDQVNGDSAPDVPSVSTPRLLIHATMLTISRLYSRLFLCSRNAKFHTQLSLAITMTKESSTVAFKCSCMNRFPIRSLRLVLRLLMVWAITTSKCWPTAPTRTLP